MNQNTRYIYEILLTPIFGACLADMVKQVAKRRWLMPKWKKQSKLDPWEDDAPRLMEWKWG